MRQSPSVDDREGKEAPSTQNTDTGPGCRCDSYIINLTTGELRRGVNMAMRAVAFIVLGLWLAVPAGAQEEPQQLGVGAYIGVPLGFTAKYLFDRRNAADFAVGVQGSNVDFHADVLTHFRDFSMQPAAGKLAPTSAWASRSKVRAKSSSVSASSAEWLTSSKTPRWRHSPRSSRSCAWRRARAPTSTEAWACAIISAGRQNNH